MLQVLLAVTAPALLLCSWDGAGEQLLLGTTGWHVRIRLQGLGRHLHSILLVWFSHVLVVQSLTP